MTSQAPSFHSLLPCPSHIIGVFRKTGPFPLWNAVRLSDLLGVPFMGRKLYVGNLTYGVTDSALEQMFAPHGTVESAQVIMDRDTGRSKGFGFVEMKTDQEAQAAIAAMNGKEVDGRSLTVNEAKPREDRGGGRGGSGGGRGGYGGGRGGYGGGGGRRY